MRKWCLFVVFCLLCTACSSLPPEERAFCVVLLIDGNQDSCTVAVRIPDYAQQGGYQTLKETGNTLSDALGRLESHAALRLHWGQMRLIVFSRAWLAQEPLSQTLQTLMKLENLRLHTALGVTEEQVEELASKIVPTNGTRLSKSIDVMLQTHQEQGTIISCTMSEVLRMGTRQSPVLADVHAEGETFSLSGGWMIGTDGLLGGRLSPEEMQLCAFMMGRLSRTQLLLPAHAVHITEATSRICLLDEGAICQLSLRYDGTELTPQELSSLVGKSCIAVLEKLRDASCDALGLGRQAIGAYRTMLAWQNSDFAKRLAQMQWTVEVSSEPAA